MYFKRLETKGLAHYSYILGHGKRACIIDPMRDIGQYLENLRDNGLQLEAIFETHRNEDYISGSMELSQKTGAPVYISGHEDLGYEYGEKIFDGDSFEIGEIKIKALHTPGHTKGHLSYVVYEGDRETPYMVFTGDCLFMGDIGRTDFYGPDQLEEMTGKLYDSIFNGLFCLGDHVLAFPAHGNGSACGESMEDRPYTSIGYERIHNPKLQYSNKEDFINGLAKMRIKPRYFEKMEVSNIKGAPFMGRGIDLGVMDLNDVEEDMVIIDLRSPEAFCANHIPGSIYFSKKNLASFLGTLLDTEERLVFLAENDHMETLEFAYLTAKRIGFESVVGYLEGGIGPFLAQGREGRSIDTISAKDYLSLDQKTTLDIRGVDRLEEMGDQGDGTIRIPLKVLHEKYQDLDKKEKIYILCNSGNTATSAASYLLLKGYHVIVIEGGIQAVEALK